MSFLRLSPCVVCNLDKWYVFMATLIDKWNGILSPWQIGELEAAIFLLISSVVYRYNNGSVCTHPGAIVCLVYRMHLPQTVICYPTIYLTGSHGCRRRCSTYTILRKSTKYSYLINKFEIVAVMLLVISCCVCSSWSSEFSVMHRHEQENPV